VSFDVEKFKTIVDAYEDRGLQHPKTDKRNETLIAGEYAAVLHEVCPQRQQLSRLRGTRNSKDAGFNLEDSRSLNEAEEPALLPVQ
jgi:hypothetical protein